jgi:hypothetical protein
MRNKTGAEFMPRTPEAATALREAGIPGIRYLDQGSRGIPADIAAAERRIAGLREKLAARPTDTDRWLLEGEQARLAEMKPSYNYVVTDPSKLDILAKYGVVGGAPAGMGAIAAQDRYQQ